MSELQKNGSVEQPDVDSPPNPEIITRLSALGDMTPSEMARITLGDEYELPDEVLVVPEGVTFFQGKRTQEHKASGATESLLSLRLKRIGSTATQK